MMVQALQARLAVIRCTLQARWRQWLLLTSGFAVTYYLILMASLVVKFGALPNYAVAYDWPEAVWTIVVSTPAVSDMLPIIGDEWLLEVGYMNHDFGHGISEWALSIIPAKLLVVLVFAALLAVNILLMRDARRCSATKALAARSAAGLGAGLVALTSATMSWVVCCATPTWVVGLSMLGLGVSTALWLEPVGPWLTLLGFACLAGSALAAAREAERTWPRQKEVQA